ncbi:MAG: nucleoside phosphorylase [Erysipelotrichaceae bacterium]|nr:nucleoside phosphorylase [Erysipelotrichaceae bacterium]
MIDKAFDDRSPAMISPRDAISQEALILAAQFRISTFIVTFSCNLIKSLYEKGTIEILHDVLQVGSAAGKNPIYRIRNTDIGVILCGIGAPAATAILEEIRTLFNCRNFIVFGSCGSLVDLPAGRVIIPDEAYRDEGTSYHYAPASDFITVKNADKLAEMMEQLEVGYVKGKTWTTDAFYRETVNNRNKRVEQGCICVEMECSRLQAMCDFRGIELYQFVYAADSLDSSWSRRILGNLEMDSRLKYFYLAWEIAKRID